MGNSTINTNICQRLIRIIVFAMLPLLPIEPAQAGVDFRNPDNKYMLYMYLAYKLTQTEMQYLTVEILKQPGFSQGMQVLSIFEQSRVDSGDAIAVFNQVLCNLEALSGDYTSLYRAISAGLIAMKLNGLVEVIRGQHVIDVDLHLNPPENNSEILDQLFRMMCAKLGLPYDAKKMAHLSEHIYKNRYDQAIYNPKGSLPLLVMQTHMKKNNTHWFYLIEGLSATDDTELALEMKKILNVSDTEYQTLRDEASELRANIEGVVSISYLDQQTHLFSELSAQSPRMATSLYLPAESHYLHVGEIFNLWTKRYGSNATVERLCSALERTGNPLLKTKVIQAIRRVQTQGIDATKSRMLLPVVYK